MKRERISRRKGLVANSEEIHSDSPPDIAEGREIVERLQRTPGGPEKFTNCLGRNICGDEAACRQFPNNTSKCVCTHDSSTPTDDLKCLTRITVSPEVGKPIPVRPPISITKNNTDPLPDRGHVEETDKEKIAGMIGVLIACLVVIGIIAVIFRLWRRKCYSEKVEGKTLDLSPMNLTKSLLLPNKYIQNPQYFGCTPPEVPILHRDHLVFMFEVGEGCFGKVYKGELRHVDRTEIVAVKVLKDGASREAEEDFMREVEIMSTFHHDNILSLVGVVLRDSSNSPWMVFQFMPHGDLAKVLRANSRQFPICSISGLEPLTKDSLYWIVVQIASGMTYLSAQRFVHRDLACRNCLVGDDLVVKIADFGMSRDIYTCDYYKIGGSRMLPVRWMSPESVIYGRFTLESDVWSFGVVLWEVYSYGKQPYYGHTNEEVVKLISQGIMLIPPEDCPPFICKIMSGCWKSEPRDRFKFPEILERLQKGRETVEMEKGSLPRPPQGPVTIPSLDILDTGGYLVPAPTQPKEYLQPLPPFHV
ncbi:high affinity nerve growth factor receptor isoform X1 [Fopius arisanus]|uniref:High affinity nerve growth factor receptor isoform X1 n=1 Tax=Fopius arisanus TaxID=64838 RepID=A0A9R1U0F7_9HYME|nr:PREDICTED: high affinity nerve growth factor receptor-like isoform X1 [Fopius arisanus]XP_011304540.1 PREDICTED: high affinity nerve growth factor receptor-like isoform X1 [Fopius arisanus]XP_011304541.1 PREDICTED: high affinity nerve growth factor receptor-like isoform X1 [Fopius arisanus]XP_011304542.1 PREDICTED: high affinity nerve growth factor receptor-like isoform X1 [Fopius arisanus]